MGAQSPLARAADPGYFLNVQPNPFRKCALISTNLPPGGKGADLELYDITGRLVRTFKTGPAPAGGPVNLTWDGTDDRGRAAAAGVYFLRLRSGPGTIVQKIIRIR